MVLSREQMIKGLYDAIYIIDEYGPTIFIENARQSCAKSITMLKQWDPRWVSVKARLPEPETCVIALVKHEVGWCRMFAWLDDTGKWQSSAEEFKEQDGDRITHWLPIPGLPEEVHEVVGVNRKTAFGVCVGVCESCQRMLYESSKWYRVRFNRDEHVFCDRCVTVINE